MVKYSVTGDSHTMAGIRVLGNVLKAALIDRYVSAAMSMYRWEDSTGKIDSMQELSCFTVPEKYLMKNSRVALFEYGGETHCLPVAQSDMVNMYGYQNKWHVTPTGNDWTCHQIQRLTLTHKDSVMINNCLRGALDYQAICYGAVMEVDGMLTLYQRGLMARAPFVFNTEGKDDANVSNYMNAILNFSPWVVRNIHGSMMTVEVSDINVTLDPALIDLISHWRSFVLSYIGYDATDIHKRAQQSVPETKMGDSFIKARRMEKLACRQRACDIYNEKFGNDIKVISVLDEINELGRGYDGELDYVDVPPSKSTYRVSGA